MKNDGNMGNDGLATKVVRSMNRRSHKGNGTESTTKRETELDELRRRKIFSYDSVFHGLKCDCCCFSVCNGRRIYV